MGCKARKSSTPLAAKAIAASAALALGAGLTWANYYASAHESNNQTWGGNQTKVATAQVATISCPDIGQKLTNVPQAARGGVLTELDNLDKQITEAYNQLASTRQAQNNDPSFVQNAIVGPLKDKRRATIDRIRIDIQRAGGQFNGSLSQFAACTTQSAGRIAADGQNDGHIGGQQQNSSGMQANKGGQANNGPAAADFVDITNVAPNVPAKPQQSDNASTGTFTTHCCVNANQNHNSDNVIVAPGVTNGAHHVHDYVGNQKVNAFSSDQTLLQGGTSCLNTKDLSAYYVPVLRVQDGTQDFDQNADGGGKDLNVGRILIAQRVQIKYVGNPSSKVVAMPQFLRITTGDAKAFTNGTANANAHWSCTGFESKVQLTTHYPICPQGSKVVRTFAFPNCWDGQNIDSANHRTHVAFPDPASGVCPNSFKAIPQLTMRLTYDMPQPVVQNGQVKNAYAVDAFPEQLHKPFTDHDDFISVTTGGLANKIANCLNSGRKCF